MADTIIKNGIVVTCEPDLLRGRMLDPGAVAVEDGRIMAVGPEADILAAYPGAGETVDAGGGIIMPGFIITHTHMPYVLGHNQPVDVSQLGSFWDMLQKMGWEWLEDITTCEGIYAATRYAAMKMLKNGTTTVCELVEAPNGLDGDGGFRSPLDASLKAVGEIGIRAQLGYEVTERIPGVSITERLDPEMAEKGFEENLKAADLISDRLAKEGNVPGGDRVSVRMGVHTAYTNSPETLRRARELADRFSLGMQIHIAEIPRAFLVEKYGKSAPALLEECGLLGPDVVAAHCIDLNEEDLDILARNEVNVAHTPMTNSLGGNGVAPVPEMMERNINVSLGHDCFFTLDTAEYIRYAYLLHKAHRANPAVLPPFLPVDFALSHGARALGMENAVGSLRPGKQADIIIIKPDSPVPVTPETVISFLTMTFQGRNVDSVFVAGERLVEGGRAVRVNEEELRGLCVDEARKMWARNGITV